MATRGAVRGAAVLLQTPTDLPRPSITQNQHDRALLLSVVAEDVSTAACCRLPPTAGSTRARGGDNANATTDNDIDLSGGRGDVSGRALARAGDDVGD